ncbi:MAG: hypothetical protein Q8P05_05305 [Candidatus Diapherotrites archaeon]|nr:hypothetical protein [Candidatus Diapherotrites archaeon]
MVTTEMVMAVGLFIVQLIVAVYLIRYSNQQLMGSISHLRDKNLELMKLNARLTKTVIMNEKSLRGEIESIKHVRKGSESTEVRQTAPIRK